MHGIMYYIKEETISDAYLKVIDLIMKKGDMWQTINGKVKEIMPLVVQVENPTERTRLFYDKKFDLVENLAELVWRLAGRDDLEFMKRYLKNLKYHTVDGEIWSGAYSKRLFDYRGINQMMVVLDKIQKNRYVREAVLCIYDPVLDSGIDNKSIPCFNEVIVAINGNNELDMFISMRANDAYNYFGGTNFFVWSVILEIMSNWLKVKPGKYYLFVGSMEIFERDFEKSMRLCNNHLEYCSNSGLKKRMQGITIALDTMQEELNRFFELEMLFRNVSLYNEIVDEIGKLKDVFLRDIAKILFCYWLWREKEWQKYRQVVLSIDDEFLRDTTLLYFD